MIEHPALSIVIPVFNGATTIERVVAGLQELDIAKDMEIILVNDASGDQSAAVCETIVQTSPVPTTLINHARNFGEHNAIMTGLRHARGAHVITIDDDLQNPPSEVMRLYEYALNSGKDVVYSRYARKQHATWRNLGSWFANCCANTLFDKPKELYLSSFRCMNQFCATEITRYEGPYPYVDGLIMQCTNSFASIEVEHHTRTEGRSGYTLKKLIQLWMRIALNFSVIPLRICTLIGLMVSLMGFGGIIWVFADYVMNGVSAPGWTTLMIFMITFSGVQLIMLGIVGEYLGRLFMTANRKPQSVVRDVIRTVDRLGENTTEEVTLI